MDIILNISRPEEREKHMKKLCKKIEGEIPDVKKVTIKDWDEKHYICGIEIELNNDKKIDCWGKAGMDMENKYAMVYFGEGVNDRFWYFHPNKYSNFISAVKSFDEILKANGIENPRRGFSYVINETVKKRIDATIETIDYKLWEMKTKGR